jgi:formamidopyrimidine-DNA glycosylase
MPELPEVETVVRTLEKQIAGEEIQKVTVRWPKVVEGMDPETFCRRLQGRHFLRFNRRGKYLLLGLEDSILIVHLRMEGKFYLMPDDEPLTRHMHVIFQLDGRRQLRYHDTRKFGRMTLVPPDTDFTHFHNLGPEPFDDAFNAAYMHAWKKGRKEPIKSLLLDQSFVAGIGNIYADEILAACHIRPGRSCARLTRREEEAIVANTRFILREAIRLGGTTIRSYTSSLGVTGRFQSECAVHGQKVCPVCGTAIKVKWIGGRSSYYCPHCQH